MKQSSRRIPSRGPREFTIADILRLANAIHGDGMFTRGDIRRFLGESTGEPDAGPRGATLFFKDEVIAVAALLPFTASIPRLAPVDFRKQSSEDAIRDAWVAGLVQMMLGRGGQVADPDCPLWAVLSPGAIPGQAIKNSTRSPAEIAGKLEGATQMEPAIHAASIVIDLRRIRLHAERVLHPTVPSAPWVKRDQ